MLVRANDCQRRVATDSGRRDSSSSASHEVATQASTGSPNRSASCRIRAVFTRAPSMSPALACSEARAIRGIRASRPESRATYRRIASRSPTSHRSRW